MYECTFSADRDWVEVWNCLNDSVLWLGDSLSEELSCATDEQTTCGGTASLNADDGESYRGRKWRLLRSLEETQRSTMRYRKSECTGTKRKGRYRGLRFVEHRCGSDSVDFWNDLDESTCRLSNAVSDGRVYMEILMLCCMYCVGPFSTTPSSTWMSSRRRRGGQKLTLYCFTSKGYVHHHHHHHLWI